MRSDRLLLFIIALFFNSGNGASPAYAIVPNKSTYYTAVDSVQNGKARKEKIPSPGNPIYKDVHYPIEQRVEDLLSRMTLEEKAGQMNMPCVYIGGVGKSVEEKLNSCRKLTEGKYIGNFGPIGGFFLLRIIYCLRVHANKQSFLTSFRK